MVKAATRKYVRRRFVGKKQTVMKAVAKRVVKNALARTLEHKRIALLLPDRDVYYTTQYVFNPISSIAKGTSEDNRIGDQIHNAYLNLAFSFFHTGLQSGTTRVWNGTKLRIVVIRSNKQLGTGINWVASHPTTGDFQKLFAEPLQSSISPVNTHDYTVLADRTISSHYDWDTIGTYAAPGVAKLRVNLGKQIRFQDNPGPGGYAMTKGTQVYVIMTASNVQSGTSDLAGKVQVSGYLSFTDA